MDRTRRCRQDFRTQASRVVIGILFASLLLLSACRSVVPTASPTFDPTSIDPHTWVKRAELPSTFELHKALSPDGRWLTRHLLIDAQTVQVFSVSDPDVTLEAPLPPGVGRYLSLGPWAPDSSAFILYSAEQGYSHCPFTALLLVHIDEPAQTLRYDSFAPQCAQPSPFASASWSSDSQEFAVTLNQREIYILNRQAKLQRTIKPELRSDAKVAGLWWTEFGLVYHTENVQPDGQEHELQIIDPKTPEQSRSLIQRPISLTLLGSAPQTARLLISAQDKGYPPAETFTLLVLNLDTGDIEQESVMQGTLCIADDPGQIPFTALKISKPGASCELWLYDWKQGELIERGSVVALIGWRSNAQGFLIVQGTPPDELRLEVIMP